MLYASISQKKIALDARPTSRESKPVTVQSKRTRHYKGMPCYVTQIVVPIEFVRALRLKKGQELDYETYDNRIIISQ